MKLVYLDGHTLNPGDLSWDALRTLGECIIHDRTPAEQVAQRMAEAQVAITNKAPIDRRAIDDAFPRKIDSSTHKCRALVADYFPGGSAALAADVSIG